MDWLYLGSFLLLLYKLGMEQTDMGVKGLKQRRSLVEDIPNLRKIQEAKILRVFLPGPVPNWVLEMQIAMTYSKTRFCIFLSQYFKNALLIGTK
jgi:hypothetical protein